MTFFNRQFRKKAQTAMEYLLLLGVASAAIIALFPMAIPAVVEQLENDNGSYCEQTSALLGEKPSYGDGEGGAGLGGVCADGK